MNIYAMQGIHDGLVEELRTIEALRKEIMETFSIPNSFFYGNRSHIKTATEVAMRIYERTQIQINPERSLQRIP